jgi:hypothetical protein
MHTILMIPNMTSMIQKIPSKKVINRSREEKRERQIDRWTERKKDSKTKILSNAYTILMIPNMTSIIEKIPSMKAITFTPDLRSQQPQQHVDDIYERMNYFI